MMTGDDLMTSNDRAEQLSLVYVQAVAAGASYTTANRSLDRDGVDIAVNAGGSMRPSLDIQLKATRGLGLLRDGCFHFPLKVRNYDLLRVETIIPRLLVVLDLPQNELDWLRVTPAELIIRKAAYWLNLRHAPETGNVESVTVPLPQDNLFDVAGLRSLMQQARSGAIG